MTPLPIIQALPGPRVRTITIGTLCGLLRQAERIAAHTDQPHPDAEFCCWADSQGIGCSYITSYTPDTSGDWLTPNGDGDTHETTHVYSGELAAEAITEWLLFHYALATEPVLYEPS